MKATGKLLASALVLSSTLVVAKDDERKPPQPPRDGESVILFLLDNSASLPPLDPDTQRRDAIEKIYGFLKGQPYRLILFGGRHEIYIDKPQYYRNGGKWTDFFFAFEATRKIIDEYPEGTDFKVVLITDGIIDPSPRDWSDQNLPEGADVKKVAGERTTELLKEMGLPLYVILIGEKVDYDLIRSMVAAANGSMAGSEYAQGIADFFDDDGMLLRRFIFRVEKDEGLRTIEPIVTRIATPSTPKVELTITGSLMLMIAVLIGIGVRSFPGSGDREIVELRTAQAVQIAVDRLRRLSSDIPAWSRKGLSLVESSRTAVAGLTAKEESNELPPTGFSLDGLDEIARSLIELPLAKLGERMETLTRDGTKDEQIYALNLEYAAKDMEEPRVERLIASVPSERVKFPVLDFLRAKVHLLHNEKLKKKLTGPCVTCKVYGIRSDELELRPGSKVGLGPYRFRVDELTRGGRKDFKLGLTYETVPSPLFLKRIVPGALQRVLRLRRTHERIVR